MSITITPLAPERLAVSDDFEMELPVPLDARDDRFHLAFSDGTLIAGEYDPEEDAFHYLVEVEGAGITRIEGSSITLDWRAEWLTIATYRPDAVPIRSAGPLPLFDLS